MDMIKKGDKVYLVKYALSDGISRQVVSGNRDISDDFLQLEGYSCSLFKIGRDVFIEPHKAIEAAEKMRAKKIKSIEKQLIDLKVRQFMAPID